MVPSKEGRIPSNRCRIPPKDGGSLTLTLIFTYDAFWRVSGDTETCGSPLYLRLPAVYVSLLAPKGRANIDVLYHIYCYKSSEIKELKKTGGKRHPTARN
jgi:hypothetical protein